MLRNRVINTFEFVSTFASEFYGQLLLVVCKNIDGVGASVHDDIVSTAALVQAYQHHRRIHLKRAHFVSCCAIRAVVLGGSNNCQSTCKTPDNLPKDILIKFYLSRMDFLRSK